MVRQGLSPRAMQVPGMESLGTIEGDPSRTQRAAGTVLDPTPHARTILGAVLGSAQAVSPWGQQPASVRARSRCGQLGIAYYVIWRSAWLAGPPWQPWMA